MTRQRERGDATDGAHLAELPITALRELWSQRMGRAAAPAQKRLLVRELAWRAQERVHGGLDAQTRRLLGRAIRAATKRPAADDSVVPITAGSPAAKRRPRGAASTVRASGGALPPATRLSRTWRGVRHEVDILEAGRRFRYRDQIYGSLSEIAREITGTRWSGPRFFGLTTREEGEQSSDRDNQRRRRGGDGSP